MSYFPCDIPYMSDEELKKSGIHIPKDASDNNIEYIRKQDMLDAVEKLDIIPSVNGMGIPTDAEDFRVQFIGTVLKVKPADVVPVVHGHWIPYRCDMYECSVCQHIHTSFDSEECDAYYCPHCGAKMDAKEE